MNDDNEYEVESITQAKVTKKKGKGQKLVWKYCVRWKGYSPEHDTWEPTESFVGSEDIVQKFWERADSGGRDINNLSLFKEGDLFLPLGPPRRKIKRKSVVNPSSLSPAAGPTPSRPEGSNQVENKISTKRRRSSFDKKGGDDYPAKRPREHEDLFERTLESVASPTIPTRKPLPTNLNGKPQTLKVAMTPSASYRKNKRPHRSPSIEVIPDSDEETEGGIRRDNAVSDFQCSTSRNPHNSERLDDSVHSPSFTSKLPSHRMRVEMPLVKMMDDPNLSTIDGAIPAKMRVLEKKSASLVTAEERGRSRSKPGPGRSSSGFISKSNALTLDKSFNKTTKGALHKSVEGENGSQDITQDTHETEIHDSPLPEIPGNMVTPSGEELLKLAGLDPDAAETLPDFEEMDTTEQAPPSAAQSTLPPDNLQQSVIRNNLNLVKDKLFPSSSFIADQGVINPNWKKSTIFGPLGLGSDSLSQGQASGSQTDSSKSPPFLINLDSSISIPVLLVDISPPNTSLFAVGSKGPNVPGKFYKVERCLSLLDTMRTGGPSAQVVVLENVADETKRHFERFAARLEVGDVFVALAGAQLLAFCSSSNNQVCQKLNIPPKLPGKTLVSQVFVENYSGYADAASNADEKRWSQYFQETS